MREIFYDFPALLPAYDFAAAAHHGQTRKYSGEPYVNHPARVARSLLPFGMPDAAMQSALLHDVIEDCGVTPSELDNRFGLEVSRFVLLLTNPKEQGVPRYVRKRHERLRLQQAPGAVQVVKCADILDNASDILQHEIGFACVWYPEARALLDVMDKARGLVEHGMPLWKLADERINVGLMTLGVLQ